MSTLLYALAKPVAGLLTGVYFLAFDSVAVHDDRLEAVEVDRLEAVEEAHKHKHNDKKHKHEHEHEHEHAPEAAPAKRDK